MNKYIRLLLYLFFAIALILFIKTLVTLSQTLTPDFSVYYTAAKNMIAGNSVYVGHTSFTLFAYPLVSTLPLLLFTLFPYQIAQAIFLFISASAFLRICLLVPYLLIKKRSLQISGLIFIFAYFAFPTKFTLGMGQINFIAYVLLLLSFFLYNKHKIFWTALLFTIACICKPILGFTLLFFIVNKQWKIIFYSLGFFAVWFWLPLLIDKNALMDYLYYFRHVIPEVSKPSGREIYYNQGFSAFIFRMTTNQFARILLSYLGMIGIFIGGLFAIFKQKKNQLYQFSLLLAMIPLLDPMSWQHHFIILILPFAYAAYQFYKQKQYKLLGLLFLAYLLVSVNIKNPIHVTSFPYNIIESHTFFGAALLFGILVFMPKLKLIGKFV